MSKDDEVEIPKEITKSGVQKMYVRLHKKLTKEYEGCFEAVKKFGERKFSLLEKQLVAEYGRLRESTEAWIKQTDGNLAAFEKKYGGLYTVLTRTFLVKMEGRIGSQEIFTQAVLDLMLERMYVAEFSESPEDNEDHFTAWRERLAKRHQELMQKITGDIANLKAKESLSDGHGESDSEAGRSDAGGNRDDVQNSGRSDGTTDSKTD